MMKLMSSFYRNFFQRRREERVKERPLLSESLALSGEAGLCGKYFMPFIRKSQYRTQMTYPVPNTQNCHPLGHTEIFWGAGKEFPYKGSDFGYLIWRKRDCCLF